MFEASRPFLLFDYFRVPYRAVEAGEWRSALPPEHALGRCAELRWSDGGTTRSLYWPRAEEIVRERLGRRAPRRIGSARLFAASVDPEVAAGWLRGSGRRWHDVVEIRECDGGEAAAVSADDDGNLFVPFDPDEAIQQFWTEGYRTVDAASLASALRRLGAASYYRVRPALPRTLQLSLRRAAARFQARAAFPTWPVETSLHDLYDLLFRLVYSLARRPIPWIAPWPAKYDWALVLTHDVETRVGYENIALLRDLELEHGYRSSWNLVPRRYEVDDDVVAALLDGGFEVGVHGLYHDGRDVERSLLADRLPAMRAAAERWQASGFRSPATRRDARVMPMLGFEHDSSFPETDPFEPDGGGCCSWLPYFLQDLVELPITLPQDHTLFEILRADGDVWREKTEHLRKRGAMALLITHPDYMLDRDRLEIYASFLRAHEDDATAWRALPRDVSAWWRRRAVSTLEWEDGAWRVKGPASAEAQIRYLSDEETSVARGSDGIAGDPAVAQ